jgi:hypothetical protein
MLATTINTTRFIFFAVACAAAVARFNSAAAPETETAFSEADVSHVVIVAEPAPVPASIPPAGASAAGDIPRVVVTAKRMTAEQKAAFDALEKAEQSTALAGQEANLWP